MRRSIWFWLFILVLVVLLLGIIFGGYRKGTKVGAPGEIRLSGRASVSSTALTPELPTVATGMGIRRQR
ncbi:MAG TPA: hypothetical protein VHX38_27660 [Pseudonocardiaceae bacterium]|jgi:hypothetical protein|nr:hypothetical protein [Pseudonocardiaceae bacterium]